MDIPFQKAHARWYRSKNWETSQTSQNKSQLTEIDLNHKVWRLFLKKKNEDIKSWSY